jgi:hypothetical protein
LFLSVKRLFFGLESVIGFGARLVAALDTRVRKRGGGCVLRARGVDDKPPTRKKASGWFLSGTPTIFAFGIPTRVERDVDTIRLIDHGLWMLVDSGRRPVPDTRQKQTGNSSEALKES